MGQSDGKVWRRQQAGDVAWDEFQEDGNVVSKEMSVLKSSWGGLPDLKAKCRREHRASRGLLRSPVRV